MAYVSTVTTKTTPYPQCRQTVVTVVETGGTTSAHIVDVPVPLACTITSISAVLTAGNGTATTVDPALGYTNASAAIFDNGTAAASILDVTSRRVTCPANVAYLRSRADGTTGTTGNVTTTIVYTAGHVA